MRQWWYKQSKTNCLLMWIEQSLGPSERSHLLCVITCFLKRNTVPSQQLFPICLEWSGWDATVFFFFFQRHLTPAMHLYLFQMKSEMLSLSLPCHGCDAWDGIYNHKVRPPLGIFRAPLLTNLNYWSLFMKKVPSGKGYSFISVWTIIDVDLVLINTWSGRKQFTERIHYKF